MCARGVPNSPAYVGVACPSICGRLAVRGRGERCLLSIIRPGWCGTRFPRPPQTRPGLYVRGARLAIIYPGISAVFNQGDRSNAVLLGMMGFFGLSDDAMGSGHKVPSPKPVTVSVDEVSHPLRRVRHDISSLTTPFASASELKIASEIGERQVKNWLLQKSFSSD